MRTTALAFQHTSVRLPDCPADQVVAAWPVAASAAPFWVVLTRTGRLVGINLEAGESRLLAALPIGDLDLRAPVLLRVDETGRYAAVANSFGLKATVVDLQAGNAILSLAREPYCEEVCIFPLAFVTHQGHALLVHATAWNRLEVTDPETGASMVARPADQRLDYFHSDLWLSPDHTWIADNGWVWHPAGVIATWNVSDWLSGNPWESDDSPSRREFCGRTYFWNGPLCWLDASTLAVWGFGDDADDLIPAVRVFDVTTGDELRWFPGPEGTLYFDGYLFSVSESTGTEVWDIATGERLHAAPEFTPTSYHHGSGCFLSLQPDGSYLCSRLRPLGPTRLLK